MRKTKGGLFTFFLLAFCVSPVFAGQFNTLEPGKSFKRDVDRALGRPTREVLRGLRYDYDPSPYKARRISVTFGRKTRRIETIDIYWDTYIKDQYRKLFALGRPVRSIKDAAGNLVEFYLPQGISLHYGGPSSSYPVEFFSHFDPALVRGKEPVERGATDQETPLVAGGLISERDFAAASDDAFEGKDYREMKRVLDEGIGLHPNSVRLWRDMVRYYLKCSWEPDRVQREGALKAAVRLIALEPSDKNRVAMGWVCQEVLGDCPSALFYYEAAWETYATKRPDLCFYMARCYEKLNKLEEAEVFYGRFLRIAPDHRYAGEARIARGDVRLRIKEMQDREYGATRDSPSLDGAKQAEGYYVKACREAFKRKDYQEMKFLLDEGTRFYPESRHLFMNLVRYYIVSTIDSDEERIEEALKAAARVMAIDSSGVTYASMGWVFHEMLEDCSSALFYYERAGKAYAAKRPDLYFFMARCYEDLDTFGEAEDYYKRFLDSAPGHKHADEARRRLAALMRGGSRETGGR